MSEHFNVTVKFVLDTCPGLQEFVNERKFCFHTLPDRRVVVVVDGEAQPFDIGVSAGASVPADIADTLNVELGITAADRARIVTASMRKAGVLGEIRED